VRSAVVVATYQRCRAALAALRGLAPSAAIQGLFKTFQPAKRESINKVCKPRLAEGGDG
jgi:hypothetical protein